MQLERTLDDDGYYLGKFESKEEAEEWVDEQVNRYLFTPYPKEMSIRRICREAEDEGINLYPNTFSKELKRRGIDIRNSRPRATTRETRTFSLDKEAVEQLDEFVDGDKSFIVDLGLKIVVGFPVPHVLMFLPEEDGETVLVFRERRKNRVQLYISGTLDMKFETQLRNLLQRAEKNGMEEIVDYAKKNGYRYYGGSTV